MEELDIVSIEKQAALTLMTLYLHGDLESLEEATGRYFSNFDRSQHEAIATSLRFVWGPLVKILLNGGDSETTLQGWVEFCRQIKLGEANLGMGAANATYEELMESAVDE